MQVLKSSFNKDIIQQILDSFVELTRIRAAFYDDCTEIVSGNNKDMCSFCMQIRKYREVDEACIECDKIAFITAAETKKLFLYRCHMGLLEAVAPVILNGYSVGYCMLGQVKDTEDITHWNETRKKLQLYGFDPTRINALESYHKEIEVADSKRIQAAVRMLDIIANYVISADIIYIYDMEVVGKAKNIMDEQFKECLSQKAIADSVGLSPAYMSNLFKRQTGITMTDYIEAKRLQYAKHLLTMTDLSVKEISQECGYEDQNYFSRLFKKRIKENPSGYRLKNKKEC